MKREYFYISLITILIGAGLFGGGYYRKENRALKQENEVLAEASAMLLKENERLLTDITHRDYLIKKSVAVYDSLQKKLISINDKKIITEYPNYNTVRSLDLDAQLLLLTRHLNAVSCADSIGN